MHVIATFCLLHVSQRTRYLLAHQLEVRLLPSPYEAPSSAETHSLKEVLQELPSGGESSIPARVIRVIDGDTIEYSVGERRSGESASSCVDTPETIARSLRGTKRYILDRRLYSPPCDARRRGDGCPLGGGEAARSQHEVEVK